MSVLLAFALAASSPALGDRIADAVRVYLEERLESLGREAHVSVLTRLKSQSPEENDAVSFSVVEPAGGVPRERLAVPVHVRVAGRPVRTATVRVSLSEPRHVLAYDADHRAGTPLQALSMSRHTVNMACCAGTPAGSAMATREAVLARPVRAGQPVMLEDFAEAADVLRGTLVNVAVGANGLATAEAVALEDGRVGERISVRARASGRLLKARVLGRGEVAIDE